MCTMEANYVERRIKDCYDRDCDKKLCYCFIKSMKFENLKSFIDFVKEKKSSHVSSLIQDISLVEYAKEFNSLNPSFFSHNPWIGHVTEVESKTPPDLQSLTSTTISSLIETLKKYKEAHGDVGVAFWDQNVVFKYNDAEKTFYFSKDKDILYLGGFHHNADEYIDIDIGDM